MNTLTNPYKNLVITRRVTAEVGARDWETIFMSCPIHGLQDRLISRLFHKFINLTREQIPPYNGLNTEESIVSLIERLTLAPDHRPGSEPDDRRGDQGRSQVHAGKEDFSATSAC